MHKLKKMLVVSLFLGLLSLINLIFITPAQAVVVSPSQEEILSGPVYDLGGGGTDVDEAIQWMIDKVRNCTDCQKKVDVVVIRSSGDNNYDQPISEMNGVDSVKTLIIQNRNQANSQDVVNAIQNAEVIFFAGGDQCEYTRNFQNTALETAVISVNDKGGAIGGTSAGAMIQGQLVFNACSDSVESDSALKDPYEDLLFTYNFLPWSNFPNVIVDTHFYQRDRMGRAMTFVARQIRDGIVNEAMAIGIDEGTSVIIDQNGLAKVIGKDYAYFILGDHLPENCEPGQSLTFSKYKIWKVGKGGTLNIKNKPTNGYYTVSVKNGKILSNPY